MKRYKYCPTCGARFDADSEMTRCSRCSRRLVSAAIYEKMEHAKRTGTLLLVTICVFLALIIVAIAIPNLLESKREPCENAAVATLRSLTSAQEVYFAKWGCYGTAAQLGPRPVGQGLIDGQMAQMTRVASMKKSGCYFRMACAPDGSGWCAVAWPTEWGITEEKVYHVAKDGTIRWRKTEGTNPDWNPENYPKRLGER